MAWSEEYPEHVPTDEEIEEKRRDVEYNRAEEIDHILDNNGILDELEQLIDDLDCKPRSNVPKDVTAGNVGYSATQLIVPIQKAYETDDEFQDLELPQDDESLQYIGLKGLKDGS